MNFHQLYTIHLVHERAGDEDKDGRCVLTAGADQSLHIHWKQIPCTNFTCNNNYLLQLRPSLTLQPSVFQREMRFNFLMGDVFQCFLMGIAFQCFLMANVFLCFLKQLYPFVNGLVRPVYMNRKAPEGVSIELNYGLSPEGKKKRHAGHQLKCPLDQREQQASWMETL